MKKTRQEFEKFTRLEEALRKNRGLAFLLSRAIAAGDDPQNVPNEIDACGICELSDAISQEVSVLFTEVWEATHKSVTPTEQSAA